MLAQQLGFTGLTMEEILDIDFGRILRALEAVILADDWQIIKELMSDVPAVAVAAHKKYTKAEKVRARKTNWKVQRLLDDG